MQQPRIAMIIPGGIGTGRGDIGVPVLERMVRRLSTEFNITVFQLYPRNKGFRVEGFALIDVYSPVSFIKILKLFMFFIRENRKGKFTCIHGFWALPSGWLAVVLGKLWGIKSIVSVLGGDAIALPEISYGQLRHPIYRSLIFWTLRRATVVIALTRYLVNNLRMAGFTRNDIRVIPWGIDTNQFFYREKPAGTTTRFLHVGNLYPVKDQETLIRAFGLIAEQMDAHLTIVGEGILKKNLERQIEALDLVNKVHIVDPVPYSQLPVIYHAADFLLHTSLSEGQCEVVTEAMSAGTIVCGTRVGLMYDCPDCCITAEVRNHTELAVAILAIIKQPEYLQEMRERARQWSHNHSIRWTVAQLTEIYQSA